MNVPPATLWPALFVTACAPSPRTASTAPPATSIIPPFSANAAAPMLNPSASTSAVTTAYRNTNDAVPVPLA